MNNIKCRAKNPASCRVHGTVSLLPIVNNSRQAAYLLIQSQKNVETVTTLEEMEEAKAILAKDQELFDMSIKGLASLRIGMVASANDYITKETSRIRLGVALTARHKLLSETPELQESYRNYEYFVKENGVTAPIQLGESETQKEWKEISSQLHAIQPGTPLALKTVTGEIIYDTAGDGLVSHAKRTKLDKLFNNLKFYRTDDYSNGSISLANSNSRINVSDIKEITPLKSGSFDNGIPEKLKSKGTSENIIDANITNKITGVEGDGYYYQTSIDVEHVNHGKKSYYSMSDMNIGIVLNPFNVTKITTIV